MECQYFSCWTIDYPYVQITASPFEDGFLYIPEVPLSAALETIQTMNSAGSDNRRRSLEREEELYRRGDVTSRYNDWLKEMDRRYTSLGRREDVTDNITLGYVTTDVSLCTFHQCFPNTQLLLVVPWDR